MRVAAEYFLARAKTCSAVVVGSLTVSVARRNLSRYSSVYSPVALNLSIESVCVMGSPCRVIRSTGIEREAIRFLGLPHRPQ